MPSRSEMPSVNMKCLASPEVSSAGVKGRRLGTSRGGLNFPRAYPCHFSRPQLSPIWSLVHYTALNYVAPPIFGRFIAAKRLTRGHSSHLIVGTISSKHTSTMRAVKHKFLS
jgi:hypothetical protein